jgi:hypothetical protein
MTIELWFCVQQRIILFFGKRANIAYPPIFSGVLANYSETEIVAHMQQMPKEIRGSQNEKSINSCLSYGSPGEIRTLVSGSRARHAWPLHHRASTRNTWILCNIFNVEVPKEKEQVLSVFLLFHSILTVASLTVGIQSSQHHNVGTIGFSFLKKYFVQNI